MNFLSIKHFARHALILGALALAPLPAAAENLTVFAAASLKDVLGAIAGEWKAAGHGEVTLSFAGSSALAKQIEQGAPADIFVSADLQWMDYVEKAGCWQTEAASTCSATRSC